MAPIELVIALIVAALVVLAVVASVAVLRAEESLPRTVAQLAFVWLVPVIGPLVALQMHRREPEPHRLTEADDPGALPGNISHRSAATRPRAERSENEPHSAPEPD